VSCVVARCFRSAGGWAITCASVEERRGVRTRSRSGEGVEKCKIRREGSEGERLSKLARKKVAMGLTGTSRYVREEGGNEGV